MQGFVHVIEAVYKSSTNAVLLKTEMGDFFHMTIGVLQGCPVLPILFTTVFLENIYEKCFIPITLPFPSVGGPYTICTLPMTSV